MNHTLARTHGTADLFVEADVRLDGGDAVVGKQHNVRVLLQQCRCAGMELDHVPVVGVVLRRIEALDVGVGDLHHGHAAVVAKRIEAIDVLAPEVQGSNVAFAVPGVLDRIPSVVTASFGPNERLEPIHAVDHDRGKVVLLGVERCKRLHHLIEGP